MAHHNELHDGVAEIASKAFTPTHVRDNPKINTCSAVRGGKENSKGPFEGQVGAEGGTPY